MEKLGLALIVLGVFVLFIVGMGLLMNWDNYSYNLIPYKEYKNTRILFLIDVFLAIIVIFIGIILI